MEGTKAEYGLFLQFILVVVYSPDIDGKGAFQKPVFGLRFLLDRQF